MTTATAAATAATTATTSGIASGTTTITTTTTTPLYTWFCIRKAVFVLGREFVSYDLLIAVAVAAVLVSCLADGPASLYIVEVRSKGCRHCC